jgi:hypothetical protein
VHTDPREQEVEQVVELVDVVELHALLAEQFANFELLIAGR